MLLFDDAGPKRFLQDKLAWEGARIAPWVLSHAGRDVGVGGFQPWPEGAGLELSFHFLPEVWGQGLASEFVQSALDAASFGLQETLFHARVTPGGTASIHILEKAGFSLVNSDEAPDLMRLRLPPLRRAAP